MKGHMVQLARPEIHEQRRDMTDKAKRIVEKMKKAREETLDEFNRSTLDDVGPIGGDKGEKFLSELNEMQDLESGGGRKERPDR